MLGYGFKTSSMCWGRPGVCVAVAKQEDAIKVQDTKTGDTLSFDKDEWSAFVAGVKKGEFDV